MCGTQLFAQATSPVVDAEGTKATEIELGYGQKKDIKTSTQSVATIDREVFQNSSKFNPEEALYGAAAGLQVFQNGGYSWENNPSIYIRGISSFNDNEPLILVDGYERDMSELTAAEIESVTVLKDAASTALYGIRGANGVILVKTRRGKEQAMQVEVSYERGFFQAFRLPQMLSAENYANAMNEALHNDGLTSRYTQAEISAFASQSAPSYYADVNWVDEAFRDWGEQNQFNVNLSGGSSKVQYFSMIDYKNEIGLYEPESVTEGIDNQAKLYYLSVRNNIDVELTPTTQFTVSVMASLRETNNPYSDVSDIMSAIYTIPSAAFPVYTEDGSWGSNNYYAENPIAMIAATGNTKINTRALMSDMRLKQDLSGLVEGLSAEVSLAFDNSASYQEDMYTTYAYQVNSPTIYSDGTIGSTSTVDYSENTSATFATDLAAQYKHIDLQAMFSYARTFDEDHNVDAHASYRQESYSVSGRNGISKRQYLMLNGSYDYQSKYLMDFVVNYSGSSYLDEGDQFRLFPAVSLGWMISEEDFMSDSPFNMLKLRASAGRSGNDVMDYDIQNQYYVSGQSYIFGSTNLGTGGLYEGDLPVYGLTCEMSTNANIGVDMALLSNKLNITADAFYDRRSNMLIDQDNIISSAIGIGLAEACDGIIDNRGVEVGINYRDRIGDFSYYVGGNFSFVKSEVIENNEGFVEYDYLSQKGLPYGQLYGYEAIGFFSDQEDIDNSPEQTFSTVRAGDIKYADQNGDDVINELDLIPIGGNYLTPEIYYAFQIGAQYKGFGFNAQFQGIENYDVMLSTSSIFRPLSDNTNISTWYMEKQRWTENNQEGAELPALTTLSNANNYKNSSVWMEDGSYLKLRSLDFYYDFKFKPSSALSKIRLYVRGNNLFSIDKIKYMDPEDISLSYPTTRSYTCGAIINF